MAIKTTILDADLLLKVQTGTDTNGKPTYTTRIVNNLNPSATDQAILDAGKGLASLQMFPLGEVSKRITTSIAEQA